MEADFKNILENKIQLLLIYITLIFFLNDNIIYINKKCNYM